MKLNIGCGKTYKDGFINIDAFDQTVADRIMPADNLKFPSNSIDEIETCQLIEHLGIFNAIYALAEWFRVLKPNGKLLIETPDLITSFKRFIGGNRETRKAVISWIYGLETLGMSHKFCFPDELLEELLEKNGFVEIKKSYFEIEKDNPALRIQCKKTKDYLPYQTVATFRKKLTDRGIADTDSYFLMLEQEKLIDFFVKKIFEFYKSKNYRLFDEIILEGTVHNVKITRIFLEECIKNKIVIKNRLNLHLEILDFLDEIDFPSILAHLIKESPDEAGTQNKVFQTVCNIGKQSIKKLLTNSKERDKIKAALSKLCKDCEINRVEFLSEEILDHEAADFYYVGVKEFFQGNFGKALAKINEAIKRDRNHLLYYWNQGRLLSLTRRSLESKRAFKNAIKLVEMSDHKNKNKLKKLLDKEMKKFSYKNLGKPVIKVD